MRPDRHPSPRTIGPRDALKGHRWAVVFDFGSHLEVWDTFMTMVGAEKKARWLNRRGKSPGGTPYEVARIDFG